MIIALEHILKYVEDIQRNPGNTTLITDRCNSIRNLIKILDDAMYDFETSPDEFG
jgi:hypothetical protein